MRPGDLLETARILALFDRRGSPRQSNLRRAASTAYYAMFHCLARCVADSFVGGAGANRSELAWRQAYRSLEHSPAKNRCQNVTRMKKFPRAIREFAGLFPIMQTIRHEADYDPHAKFRRASVMSDIEKIEIAIRKLDKVSLKHRRAFAVYVIVKERP